MAVRKSDALVHVEGSPVATHKAKMNNAVNLRVVSAFNNKRIGAIRFTKSEGAAIANIKEII